jgi:NTE family protein
MNAFSPTPGMVSKAIEFSLPFTMADAASRIFSPYTYGPFYVNPLRRIAEKFQYDMVCAQDGPDFFVAATNVRTGKIRVFSHDEISTDVLLASACLPMTFQAVEFVDPKTGTEEAFWDGGYTGNPPLFPLFEPKYPDDIVVVNINPLERNEVPVTSQEIMNRVNEISFNSSLLRELRAISFVKKLIDEGTMKKGAMKDVHIHMIADDDLMNDLTAATKALSSPYLLRQLKVAGRRAAEAFLKNDAKNIGKRSSVDLREMFD